MRRIASVIQADFGEVIRTLFVALFLLAIAPTTGAAAVIAFSGFDSGFDGWSEGIGNHPSTFTWQASGGNPSGYVKFDNNFGPIASTRMSAPSSFLGDWSAKGVETFSYDIAIFQTGDYVGSPTAHNVYISGPGGSATFTGPSAGSSPSSDWMNISAGIDESLWSVSSGSWSDILSDVTTLEVRMAFYTNISVFEITGLDNPTLSGTSIPAAIPLPAGFPLIMSALALFCLVGRHARDS